MTSFLILVSLLIQGALLFKAFEIVRELQSIRRLYEKQSVAGVRTDHLHSLIGNRHTKLGNSTDLLTGPPTAYAVWAWRGSRWELELGSVPPGFEVSRPPDSQGNYPGQRIRTECVRC